MLSTIVLYGPLGSSSNDTACCVLGAEDDSRTSHHAPSRLTSQPNDYHPHSLSYSHPHALPPVHPIPQPSHHSPRAGFPTPMAPSISTTNSTRHVQPHPQHRVVKMEIETLRAEHILYAPIGPGFSSGKHVKCDIRFTFSFHLFTRWVVS